MKRLSIFREYDIRGIVPDELNATNLRKIGYLLGCKLKQKGGQNIGIGYDARLHAKELFEPLCQGLATANCTLYDLGQIPTPVGYFALHAKFQSIPTKQLDGSIIITGSHNPPQYNGLKITFFKEPFFGQEIEALGEEFYSLNLPQIIPASITPLPVLEHYISYLTKEFAHLQNLEIPLCLDCGNGVGALGLAQVLDRLNIAYEGLFLEPDGNFPNHHPDPSDEKNLASLKELLSKKGGNGIGFAFDGDGDRLALLRPNKVIKGDELAIIFAHFTNQPFIIGEVKCSLNMYEFINQKGKALMYKTGHSNLKTKLKETQAHMAFEMSGHVFFADRYFGYDDGAYAALRVLELVARHGLDFDCILSSLPKLYSTQEQKIPIAEEEKFQAIAKLKEKLKNPKASFPPIKEIIDIDGVRVIFEDGWGLVRASNTTPYLITRFEAKTKEAMQSIEHHLLSLLQE